MGQEECERVRGWKLTLPSELPFWELESRWTLEPSESNDKGQNTSHWRVLYIIRKLLKCRCLKWVRMTPFGHLQHELWPKKRPGVKLAVWLPTTKCRESTQLLCVQVACNTPLESSWRELELCFRPHPEKKNHLDVALAEKCKICYMGEGGGFPRVRAVVSLVSPKLLVVCPSTKGAPT
jgi:hypothetical protein